MAAIEQYNYTTQSIPPISVDRAKNEVAMGAGIMSIHVVVMEGLFVSQLDKGPDIVKAQVGRKIIAGGATKTGKEVLHVRAHRGIAG